MVKFSFKIIDEYKKTRARTGIVKTAHGSFKTPAFVPVATAATVRSLGNDDLDKSKAEAVLANTYHLHMRPGDGLVKQLGGLHKFMNWNKPIITDSGGFQAFSLGFGMEHGIGKIGNIFASKKNKIKNKKQAEIDNFGVTFKSPVNGDKIRLTPEKSMKIQSNLGADIIMAFDECTSPLSGYEYTKRALRRTHDWALESLRYKDKKQALFGIVQGGEYKDLRIFSSKFINNQDFEGHAIGGSLGKNKEDMHNILEWCIPLLDKKKPIHLLGIGAVEDLFESVERGIDMFDCVAPTRWARRGYLYVSPKEKGDKKNKFRINISRGKFKEDEKPADRNCNCYTCENFSRAYLRHLFVASELLYFRLASLHNVNFILRLMDEIRRSIKEDGFNRLKKRWLKK
ncbi:tRNA guanosine(34) transglycosylase Tgt [Candidatus Woesearchaeota archaeon]|nr:tRNA guanosine(34) transglycosylase Tgt [Candidatus Woesearchaeota archaeon]